MLQSSSLFLLLLALPLFYSCCHQENVRYNGETETSLQTKSAAKCESECQGRQCHVWTWETGQCYIKRKGKEGVRVVVKQTLVRMLSVCSRSLAPIQDRSLEALHISHV